MSRITKKALEAQVAHINELTDSPKNYSEVVYGKNKIQVGHYHLSGAYGGWMLCRTMNYSGGVDCPLEQYHAPKRDLFNSMSAFIRGIELSKDGK